MHKSLRFFAHHAWTVTCLEIQAFRSTCMPVQHHLLCDLQPWGKQHNLPQGQSSNLFILLQLPCKLWRLLLQVMLGLLAAVMPRVCSTLLETATTMASWATITITRSVVITTSMVPIVATIMETLMVRWCNNLHWSYVPIIIVLLLQEQAMWLPLEARSRILCHNISIASIGLHCNND